MAERRRKTKRPAARKSPPRNPRGARADRNAPAGRPSKYSAAVRKTIVGALKDGNYRSVAFRLAGIHEDTGFEWLKLGRERPDDYPDFAELEVAMRQAEAAAEAELVKIVAQAARKKLPQSWLPAMTLLERTRPQRYARRDTTVLEGGETPIQVLTHAVINDPETRELSLDLLRRVAAPRSGEPGRAGVGHEPPDGDRPADS